MKVLRNIQYAIIIICAILAIVILTYHGKKNKETELLDASAEISDSVVISDGEIDIEDVMNAASVIISDVKEEIKDAVSQASTSGKENKSGEISYEEIVRLQEEEAALEMQADVSASNLAHGIVVSTETSTSTSTSVSVDDKNYRFAVNKTTGKIHKIGCLLEPASKNAVFYETLSEALLAGYTEKCTVCSP